ncbi:MAG: HAD family hydrolase [Nitrospina sp.]|jgi:phosphoglycolate phosphatase|nr:HAD family hydrolase [Nitrospina sp.]
MNNKRNYLSNSNIEIINPNITRGKIKFAIFDFDGTISLIREGWQQIMIPMMVDILMQTPAHESRAEIEEIVRTYVANTTGKQTIYQMIRLTEEIKKRGGAPEEPLAYKNQYHDLLMKRIVERLDGLRSGESQPEDWSVPGALDMLVDTNPYEITFFLASGTDEKYVIDEAGLLGVSKYFASIYGALDDYKNFSKKMIIQKVIKDNQLSGSELVAFGDGYVEIEDTKSVGGIAVGVATNEAERQGIDEWKRERLIASGADIIVPDFRQYQTLFDYLMMKE